MNNAGRSDLTEQAVQRARFKAAGPGRVLALGEVLWDVFDQSRRLGGAALNFAAHIGRMGHEAALISAVGDDQLGASALTEIQGLGINARFIQTTGRHATGTASVQLCQDGQTRFRIQRPAAYDAVRLSDPQFAAVAQWAPRWLYYGTLFMTTDQGRRTLRRLVAALPGAATVYDLNLRPECYSPELVIGLLGQARAVKFSESEMKVVARLADLPVGVEAFCRAGALRFGWEAAAVTFGQHGCAVWIDGDFSSAGGIPVEVADTVGAGDAFTAAFVHGLSMGWPPGEIAAFGNRIGALVASRPGGAPEWRMDEAPSIGG